VSEHQAQPDERERLVTEFEQIRAPGLRIADAALRFKRATEDLDWALWVRMAKGQRAEGAMEPLRAVGTVQLEQVLSGIFGAISLLGPGAHLTISIDEVDE